MFCIVKGGKSVHVCYMSFNMASLTSFILETCNFSDHIL